MRELTNKNQNMYCYHPVKTTKWGLVDFLAMEIMVCALVAAVYFS